MKNNLGYLKLVAFIIFIACIVALLITKNVTVISVLGSVMVSIVITSLLYLSGKTAVMEGNHLGDLKRNEYQKEIRDKENEL